MPSPKLIFERRSAVVLGVTALLAAAFCYRPALNGPLVLDDFSELIYLLEDRAEHWRAFLFSTSGPLGRPLSMASFLFNAATTGPDVGAVKATNLALHLVCSVLLGLLATSLARLCNPSPQARPDLAGTAVAAIWLLHPLHVSTVLYAVQRMTQLSTLFCLAGLAAYVAGRAADREGEDGRRWRALSLLVCWPLAVMSKENGLLFVLYLLVIEYWIFACLPPAPSARGAVRRIVMTLGVPTGILALLALVAQPDSSGAFGTHDTTLIERGMTQSRVLMQYLAMILVPWPGFMGFVHDDIGASRHLLSPATTLPSLIGVAACLVLSIVLRRRAPLATFGISFFFAANAMESTVLPLEFMFEHRCYLPSIGIVIAAIDVAGRIIGNRRLQATGLGLTLAILCALLTLRVDAWQSQDSLLADMLAIHPHSPRAQALHATQLMKAGRYSEALAAIAELKGLGPAIQRERIRCRQGEADFSLVEAMLADNSIAFDQYAIAQITVLMQRERHCFPNPEHFTHLVRARRTEIKDDSHGDSDGLPRHPSR